MTSRVRPETVVDQAELTSEVARELAGGVDGRRAVVWASQGSEVIVHLDSVALEIRTGQLLLRVDLESDETGRVNQPVQLAIAEPAEPANFTAAVDLSPGGDTPLAARWGPALQDALWRGVLRLAGEDAAGVAAAAGELIVYRDSATATVTAHR